MDPLFEVFGFKKTLGDYFFVSMLLFYEQKFVNDRSLLKKLKIIIKFMVSEVSDYFGQRIIGEMC